MSSNRKIKFKPVVDAITVVLAAESRSKSRRDQLTVSKSSTRDYDQRASTSSSVSDTDTVYTSLDYSISVGRISSSASINDKVIRRSRKGRRNKSIDRFGKVISFDDASNLQTNKKALSRWNLQRQRNLAAEIVHQYAVCYLFS